MSGRDEGLAQFNNTLKRLKTDKVELLQVHNLRDWKTQIEVARELKKQGKVKYVGVTHYVDSAHDEIADVVQATKPDFLQINHSVTNRGIEKRVLPLAKELGVAVLTNRNFNDGAFVPPGRRQAAAGVGRGSRHHVLGADVPEILAESRGRHGSHPRHGQTGSSDRQPEGGVRAAADAGAAERIDRSRRVKVASRQAWVGLPLAPFEGW